MLFSFVKKLYSAITVDIVIKCTKYIEWALQSKAETTSFPLLLVRPITSTIHLFAAESRCSKAFSCIWHAMEALSLSCTASNPKLPHLLLPFEIYCPFGSYVRFFYKICSYTNSNSQVDSPLSTFHWHCEGGGSLVLFLTWAMSRAEKVQLYMTVRVDSGLVKRAKITYYMYSGTRLTNTPEKRSSTILQTLCSVQLKPTVTS